MIFSKPGKHILTRLGLKTTHWQHMFRFTKELNTHKRILNQQSCNSKGCQQLQLLVVFTTKTGGGGCWRWEEHTSEPQ